MLKKNYRLTKHGSFGFVYRKGENKASAAFSLFYVKSTSLKVGFSVSNKLGKATVRNKIKRRMRAIIRSVLPLPKYQIVLVAKLNSVTMSFDDMRADILRLLTKAGLIATANERNEKKETE